MPESTRLPLPMRVVAGMELEAPPAAKAVTASALEGASTVIEVAITSKTSSIIHNTCTQGSSSAHSIAKNRRLHGSSSSGDIRSIRSAILGSAGLDRLLSSSIGVKHPTRSNNNNIGEETSRIGTNRARIITAVKRSTSPQSAGLPLISAWNTPAPAALLRQHLAPSPEAHVAQYVICSHRPSTTS